MMESQNSDGRPDSAADNAAATGLPVYTVGHSTRTIAEFAALLRAGQVEMVVDIRSIPRSRTNPQYNTDVLADALAPLQIAYTQIGELGGRRNKSKTITADVNGFWTNQSFHNYADYAMSADFRSGLGELRELGHMTPCVIMCAEAVWWRCHRRIISDYLMAASETVFHILGQNHVDRAQMSAGAKLSPDGSLTYPAVVQELHQGGEHRCA